MVTELTEDTVLEFIRSGHVVIKGWMENCMYCEQYSPVFESVASELPNIKFGSLLIAKQGSAFKRQFMRAEIGQKTGAPCTFIFHDGQYITRKHGFMTADALRAFIAEETKLNVANLPTSSPVSKSMQQLSIVELKAVWLDQILGIERAQTTIQAIQSELNTRR